MVRGKVQEEEQPTKKEEAMVSDASAGGADVLFSMSDMEDQFHLTLLKEHHMVKVQQEANREDDVGVAPLLVD